MKGCCFGYEYDEMIEVEGNVIVWWGVVVECF